MDGVNATKGALRACSADEIERLWDAFEAVDHAAGKIVYGSGYAAGYIKGRDRTSLREALDAYRRVRDEIDEERQSL